MVQREEHEDFRSLVDGLFEEQKEEVAEKVEAPKKKAAHKPSYRVQIPEPPAQTKEEQEASLVYAKEEMEKIRKAFLQFTDAVNETVTYSYLFSEVEEFVEACKDMQTVLTDDINKDLLTEKGLADYEKLRKIRARILSDVADKYIKPKGKEDK